MSKILLYSDQGADRAGVGRIAASIPVELVDAHALIHTPWEEEASLLIIPGGRDIYYHHLLDGRGTQRIRSFVENGGSYLGICAGAYFACETIEFAKGEPLEVCGSRSLRFFPGKAVGPAYGLYSYDNLQGARAARISWKEEDCRIYYNGGPTFVSDHDLSLGSYLDLDGRPPAIVEAKVGKGRAILSGVHFEYGIEFLDVKNPYLSGLYPSLEASEAKRKALFREILDKCL